MKLLYCIGSIQQKGGTEKVFANKANYFVDKLGYEVHLLVNESTGESAYHYSDKIVVHNMNINNYLGTPVIPYWSYNKMIKRLLDPYEKKIKEINPDIIIVLQHSVDDFIIPVLKLGIPTVREFHFSKKAVFELIKQMPQSVHKIRHYLQKKRLFKYIEKYDHVVLLTEADKKFSRYPNDNVVIPNVLDIENITLRDFSENHKRIISVGSMHDDRKGFEKQISIWKKIHNKYPDWKLDIFGDGAFRNKLQQQIDESGLTNIVNLKGVTAEVDKEFRQSSFFLFTSKAEGLPMVILEAMSTGLPCVSYDCPDGPADIIRNNENGYLVVMDDEETMIQKISLLIENREKVIRLGTEAQRTAKNYLPEKVVPLWVDFFNKIKKNANA